MHEVLVFSKEKYLDWQKNFDGSPEVSGWVDECDGKAVSSDYMIGGYYISKPWCIAVKDPECCLHEETCDMHCPKTLNKCKYYISLDIMREVLDWELETTGVCPICGRLGCTDV